MTVMTNAESTAPRKHDTSVSYAYEIVPAASIDITGWESWSYDDADGEHYFAKGPCPACFAAAQGHVADKGPFEEQGSNKGPGKVAPSVEIEIPVRCQCGFGHGRPDAMGCGRAWSVVIRRTSS